MTRLKNERGTRIIKVAPMGILMVAGSTRQLRRLPGGRTVPLRDMGMEREERLKRGLGLCWEDWEAEDTTIPSMVIAAMTTGICRKIGTRVWRGSEGDKNAGVRPSLVFLFLFLRLSIVICYRVFASVLSCYLFDVCSCTLDIRCTPFEFSIRYHL